MSALGKPIRVAVVDDDSFVRSAISGYVNAEEDLECVATGSDGSQAARLIRQYDVDVLLMDVRMPRKDGITTTRELVEAGVEIPIVILTTFDDDEHLSAALAAGARGFLLKDTSPELLVQAVHTVHAGGTLMSSAPVTRFMSRQRPLSVAPVEGLALSQRELDVLRELCRAASNAEIAEALALAESTVKAHVSSIMDKLGCTSRLKVVVKAFQLGLVEPPREQGGDAN